MTSQTTTQTTTAPARPALVTTQFVALALADLAYFTADGIAILALPLLVTGPLGGSDLAAGLAFGAFAATALVARPLAGRLTDTWGRLPVMAAGAALATVGLGLTAVADSLAAVIALRLLLGVAEAAFFVASPPRWRTSPHPTGWAKPSATTRSASISGSPSGRCSRPRYSTRTGSAPPGWRPLSSRQSRCCCSHGWVRRDLQRWWPTEVASSTCPPSRPVWAS